MSILDQGETVRVRVTPSQGAACEYPSVYDAACAARAECALVGKPPLVEMKIGEGGWFMVRLSTFV
jgi:hypothetical protein